MNLRLLAAKLFRTLAEDGPAATYRRALAQLPQRRTPDAFDVDNGTETSGIEPLWRLSIKSPNARFGERYQASTEQELLTALEFVDEALDTFSFIDLGCGKGRTLLVASRMGFRRVIGVEFAEELAKIASRNLVERGARDAVVLHADAADVTFPAGDTVVYLYNPFSEEVLARVLENLRAQQDGELYVIYKEPRCARLLDESGFLVRHGRPPAAQHIEIWRGTRGGRGAASRRARVRP